MGGIDDLARGLTGSVRAELAACAKDPEIRRLITATGLAALHRMSRTLTVSADGQVILAEGDEKWWKEWQVGSARANPLPIEKRIHAALSRELTTLY